jgi:hypothetical protein
LADPHKIGSFVGAGWSDSGIGLAACFEQALIIASDHLAICAIEQYAAAKLVAASAGAAWATAKQKIATRQEFRLTCPQFLCYVC